MVISKNPEGDYIKSIAEDLGQHTYKFCDLGEWKYGKGLPFGIYKIRVYSLIDVIVYDNMVLGLKHILKLEV